MPRHRQGIVVATLILAAIPWTLPQAFGNNSRQDDLKVDLLERLERLSTTVQQLASMGFDVETLDRVIDEAAASLLGVSSTASRDELMKVVAHVRGLVERLERVLSRVSFMAAERPELAARLIEIMSEIEGAYRLGEVNRLAASLLESGRELLDDALSPDIEPEHSARLLSRAHILAAAARQVVDGGQVILKVSKAGESGSSSNTEVNVAHILTSPQDIKVYQSEERMAYENDTVVVVRRTIISVGNMTIIEREVSRVSVSAGSGEAGVRSVEVGENVAMGAVIGLKRSGAGRVDVEKTEFDVVLQSFSTEANIIRLVLTAPDGTAGRVLVVDIDRDAVRGLLIREVSVRIDGKQVRIADSITEILQGSPDEPRYFIALTGTGIQLVIYVPKWSTRVITIGPAAAQAFYFPVSDIAGGGIQWISTIAATATLAIIVFAGWLRRARARPGLHQPRPDIF